MSIIGIIGDVHWIIEIIKIFSAVAINISMDVPKQSPFKQGETDMGEKGKKDKGKREQQKKAQLNPKEKRKLKKEKKINASVVQ